MQLVGKWNDSKQNSLREDSPCHTFIQVGTRMDDVSELIARAQKGDEYAFEALINAHYEVIYRFAYRWCGQRQDAEDVAHFACIKVGQSLRQFRFEAAFSSWLYRVVLSCANDYFRKESRHRQTEQPDHGQQAESESSAESAVYLQQLLKQLEHSGEGFKETALLVYAEGLTHQEAAYVMGVQESTVSWRLHRIRKLLSQSGNGEEQQ